MDMTEQERFAFLLESDQTAAETQYELGLCYLYGKGTELNGAEADKWLRRAAEQGYEPATTFLKSAEIEEEGTLGVTEETLPDWCMRAEEGDAEAQYRTSMYFTAVHEYKEAMRYLDMAVE